MRTLFFAFGVLSILALVGCKGLHPVGPLAKKLPLSQQGKELPSTPKEDSSASRVPAVKPTPPSLPTNLVNPEEITPANAKLMAAELSNEVSADAKTSVNAPVTVQVSHVKGSR